MVKTITGLQPNDVKGLSWWFWYKDGWASVTNALTVLVTHRYRKKTDYAEALGLIVLAPFFYAVMPFTSVLFSERNIIRGMKENKISKVQFCSKEAIEYFTMLQNLRRKERK